MTMRMGLLILGGVVMLAAVVVFLRAWLCDTMPPHWVARYGRYEQVLKYNEPSRVEMLRKIAKAEHARRQ